LRSPEGPARMACGDRAETLQEGNRLKIYEIFRSSGELRALPAAPIPAYRLD